MSFSRIKYLGTTLIGWFFVFNSSLLGSHLCYNRTCFPVEIAKSPQERAKGLMYRLYQPNLYGMLFVFEAEKYHGFWMKNTPLSLDIIWLDSNFKIVHIVTGTTPYSTEPLRPNQPARYVLELKAGQVEQYELRVNKYLTPLGMKAFY